MYVKYSYCIEITINYNQMNCEEHRIFYLKLLQLFVTLAEDVSFM